MASKYQWKQLKKRQRKELEECRKSSIKGAERRLRGIHHLEVRLLASDNTDHEAQRLLVQKLQEYDEFRQLISLRQSQQRILDLLKQETNHDIQ